MRTLLPLLLLVSCAQLPRPLPPPAEQRALSGAAVPEARQRSYRFAWADRSFVIGAGLHKDPKQSASWQQMYGWGPVFWVKTGDRTRVLDLRAELTSYTVAKVFHDEGSGKLVVFLDWGIEGPGRAYLTWLSDDRGEHWYRGADLRRPPFDSFPPADLHTFYLNAKGNGVAVFETEASNVPEPKRGGHPQRGYVYFRAVTIDGGRSWEGDDAPVFSSVLHEEKEAK